MKKLFFALLISILIPSYANAVAIGNGATCLTGGTLGCLDAIEGAYLNDKDVAIVVTGTNAYIYSLDDDSALTESSPAIISPDSNAGDKRWVLQSFGPFNLVSTYGNNLSTAATAIGTTNATTLYIDGTVTISATLDLSTYSNITFKFINAGIFAVASGQTLTLYSPKNIKASPNQQIKSGAGALAFSVGGRMYCEWWGADGSGDDNAYLQECFTAAKPNSTIVLDGDYTSNDEIDISGKTDLLITGQGSITFATGSTDAAILLNFIGTCDNVTIENIELIGENETTYYQEAIGADSGQTLSNVTIRNTKISNFNVGIDVNASAGGSATKFKIYGNELTNMVGTGTGQGYGIVLANATKSHVFNNTLTSCQRHSIYQGMGVPAYNIISQNTIVDHRATVADGNFRAAISVSRSSHVKVIDNMIIDFSDGGIIVDPVTFYTTSCTNIEVRGNKLIGRANAIPGIIVGESGVPTSYFSQYIDIVDNRIYTDWTATTSEDIRIINGKNISIRDNTIVGVDIAAAHVLITLGTAAYLNDATHFDYIDVKNNRFDLSGTDLTTVVPIYVDTDVAVTFQPHVEIEGNTMKGVRPGSREITYGTNPTNPNMSVKGMQAAYVIESGATCAAGSTNGKAKTTSNITFMYSDTIGAKNATDDLWTIAAAANTGVGEYRKVLLCLDNTGAAQYIIGEKSTSSQTDAPLPKLPNHQWIPVGVVEINASWTAGDALTGTFYDLVGIYGK